MRERGDSKRRKRKLLQGMEGKHRAATKCIKKLGVALIRGGEVEKGTALLIRLPGRPREGAAEPLRDKANVALGLTRVPEQ